MNQTKIHRIFEIFSQAMPEPVTELHFSDEFSLLVAVVLSAQATDVSVNKATPALFAKAPTPAAMVALGEDGVRECIRTIGLFNSKAKNVVALSKKLVEEHNGRVPHDFAKLQQLPGVGRKTANVFLNCALGQPTIAVDTHVQRVSNRIGLCATSNPLKTELALLMAIPKRFLPHAHHWLILHGRYVCKARTPLCGRCPIYELCEYEHKTA